jgi:predicted outer membrane protein
MSRFMTGVALGASLAALSLGVGTAHGRMASTVSGLDEQYLKTAIEGDRFEVAGGKQALAKSQSSQVRALAARLVKDHGKSLEESLALAKRLGIKAPTTPSPSMQWELQIVGTLSGKPYDHWYSDLEVKDHVQDISEATDEAAKGSNAEIRQSSRKELPTLRAHLKLSRLALEASPPA